MLFKILVILHTLGATVWTGGHLVLSVTVLPEALDLLQISVELLKPRPSP